MRDIKEIYFDDYRVLNDCLLLGRAMVEEFGVISPHSIVEHLAKSDKVNAASCIVLKFLEKYGMPWKIDEQLFEKCRTDETEFFIRSCSLAEIYVSFSQLFFYWVLWYSSVYGVKEEQAEKAFCNLRPYMHGRYYIPQNNLEFRKGLDTRLYAPVGYIGEGHLRYFSPNITLARGFGLSKQGNPVVWYESNSVLSIAYSQLQDLMVANLAAPRVCKKCGEPFPAKGRHSQYCADCGPVSSAERTRKCRARKKAALGD